MATQYFLRFTNDSSETVSFDHFEKKEFVGICCFELGDDSGLLYLNARKAAEKDNTYLNFYNGQFIIFAGSTIEANPYGNGVIAQKCEIFIEGKMTWNDITRTYQIKTTYENI